MVSDFWTPLYVYVKQSACSADELMFSLFLLHLVNIKKEDRGEEEHQLKRNKKDKGRKASMKKKTYKKKLRGNPYTEAVRRRHYISL